MGLNTGDNYPPGSLDSGTGGVRDTYKPNLGSIASQAQYSAELEKEARAKKKGLLSRLLVAVRRSIWASDSPIWLGRAVGQGRVRRGVRPSKC